MKRRLAVVPLFAVALLGLVACNNTTTGSGGPAPTADGGTPSSDDPPSSSGGGGGGSALAAIQPCALLNAGVLARYQLSTSDTTPGTGARPCDWQRPVDVNGDNGYTVEIDIRDSQGISDFNTDGYTITTDNVGKHQGQQATLDAGGTCFVTIGVTSSSRVDIGVTATNDTAQACQVANQLAKIVEPQLPGGSG